MVRGAGIQPCTAICTTDEREPQQFTLDALKVLTA